MLATVIINTRLTGSLVAVGDMLLVSPGSKWAGGDQTAIVYRSDDLGETWDEVSLPDTPQKFEFAYRGLEQFSDLVVLSGNAVADERLWTDGYVWTTTDGEMWQGGRLPFD